MRLEFRHPYHLTNIDAGTWRATFWSEHD